MKTSVHQIRNHPAMRPGRTGLGVLLALALVIGLSSCGLEPGFEYPLYPTEHYYTVHEENGETQIVREDKLQIFRGHYVVWTNKLEKPVTLKFPQGETLFGVREAVIPAKGGVLRFLVLKDAVEYEPYVYTAKVEDEIDIKGPPNLIVCPPNDPDCGP